jgi:hypothetical protein
MIKANDLRVGNKVYYNTGESIEVHLIDSVDIKLAEQYKLLFNANHSPIPLTEEWLIKMGFYKDEDISYRYYFDFGWAVILAYDLDDNCVRIGDSWDFAKATYVHQLQNLTYALTNEELTIL